MSVLWAWRKQFILLMHENFALDFNAVVILICLCDNKSVPVMEQVCHTAQPPGRCWGGASWTGELRLLPWKWMLHSWQCWKSALSLAHEVAQAKLLLCPWPDSLGEIVFIHLNCFLQDYKTNSALKSIFQPGICSLKSSLGGGQKQEVCTAAQCQLGLGSLQSPWPYPCSPEGLGVLSSLGKDRTVLWHTSQRLYLAHVLALYLQADFRHPPTSQLERYFWHQLWKKQQMVPGTRCPSRRNEQQTLQLRGTSSLCYFCKRKNLLQPEIKTQTPPNLPACLWPLQSSASTIPTAVLLRISQCWGAVTAGLWVRWADSHFSSEVSLPISCCCRDTWKYIINRGVVPTSLLPLDPAPGGSGEWPINNSCSSLGWGYSKPELSTRWNVSQTLVCHPDRSTNCG